MLCVLEVKVVSRQQARVQITPNLVLGLGDFDSAHDSRCQVDDVAEDRKFLPTSRRAYHARETFTRRNTNIAVGAVNPVERLDHVESGENGPRGVVIVREGQEAPQADQRAALVVHEELIYGALEAVDLLLDLSHDQLNLIHTFWGARAAQLDTQTDKHDRERAIFGAVPLLVDLQVGDDGVRHAARHLLLDRGEDFHRKLLADFHGVCLNFDTRHEVLVVNEVKSVALFLVNELLGLEVLPHMVVASLGYNDLTTTVGLAFGSQGLDERLANGKTFRPTEDATHI